VRELEHVLRRLAATAPEAAIGADEMRDALAQPVAAPGADAALLSASVAQHLRRYFDLHGGALPPPGLYQRILAEIEAPLLDIALEATNGNQARCAALLGINRNTLRKKIADLDIRVTRRRRLM
jgi:two-component system nitrogen regulation response regulator GlnG